MTEAVPRDTPPGDDADESPTRGEVDSVVLVGPGKYPLRIQPAAALLPGRADSVRLLIVWFVRKSFYWLFFVGYGVGTWAAYVNHTSNEVELDWTSPTSVRDALLSPWSAFVLALIVRFLAGWVALALAFPLALGHEPNLSPRTSFGSSIGRFLDRLQVARAFRALRWTHHVREQAQLRLGATGRRLGKLDPILDIVNIVSGLLAFVLVFYVAWQTAA